MRSVKMKSNWIKILYILAAVACVIAGVLLQNARLMLFLFPEAQIAILMVTGALFYFNAGYRESGLIVFDALSAPKSGERRIIRYQRDLEILSSVSRQLYVFEIALFVFALVLFLANVLDVSTVSVSVALGWISLWTVLMIRLLVLVPMQLSISRNIVASTQDPIESGKSAWNKNAIRRLAVLLALLSLIPLAIWRNDAYGSRIDQFLEPATFLVLFGLILFPAFAGLGFSGTFQTFGRSFEDEAPSGATAAYRGTTMCMLGKLSVEAGIAGLITKIIIMLGNLGDSTSILYELSKGFVALFAGILLASIYFFPFAGRWNAMARKDSPGRRPVNTHRVCDADIMNLL
jgi:hypothetical protein